MEFLAGFPSGIVNPTPQPGSTVSRLEVTVAEGAGGGLQTHVGKVVEDSSEVSRK